MTLTTRLSAFVLALLGVVLLGFSLTLHFLGSRYLYRQSDERLNGVLSTLAAAVEDSPSGLEWEPTKRQASVDESFGIPIVWFVEDEQGRILDRSPHSQTSEFIEARPPESIPSQTTDPLEWRRGPWQLRRVRLQAQPDGQAQLGARQRKKNRHAQLSITAGLSLEPVQATLTQLAITLSGLSAGILLIALIAVRIVCRRALVPVRRMAVAASCIGAEDLGRRLPSITTDDELGQLNRAFNSLLDRLQESFERQRRFTGEASHQLRTPLAGILGQIEVALRRERALEEYQRVLSVVHRRGTHLNQIVESLLFLARANADAAPTALETLCVNSWLAEQLEVWSGNERGADIIFERNERKLCFVLAQPALLRELLNILIDNACKYSSPGQPIEIAFGRENGEVLIRVTDHGCGIAEADLPHVFTPFFRSEEARRQGVEGTGLGLSIARRLAHLFGGELTVESRVGLGSCFSLRLPAAQPAETARPDLAAAPV